MSGRGRSLLLIQHARTHLIAAFCFSGACDVDVACITIIDDDDDDSTRLIKNKFMNHSHSHSKSNEIQKSINLSLDQHKAVLGSSNSPSVRRL